MEIINSTGLKLRVREVLHADDGSATIVCKWEGPWHPGDAIHCAPSACTLEIAEVECEDCA